MRHKAKFLRWADNSWNMEVTYNRNRESPAHAELPAPQIEGAYRLQLTTIWPSQIYGSGAPPLPASAVLVCLSTRS